MCCIYQRMPDYYPVMNYQKIKADGESNGQNLFQTEVKKSDKLACVKEGPKMCPVKIWRDSYIWELSFFGCTIFCNNWSIHFNNMT